jgi:hypothetical protein
LERKSSGLAVDVWGNVTQVKAHEQQPPFNLPWISSPRRPVEPFQLGFQHLISPRILVEIRDMHFQPVDPSGDDTYLTHGGGDPVPPEVVNDGLDDVFGGDEFEDAENSHPDIRRLETDHSTAGYREGVHIGKQETLQKGFDEGYPLGAAIGLQAGQIVGLLEGIAEALKAAKVETSAKSEQLLADARADLSVERLFSADYWKPTGQPSYEVAHGTSLQAKDVAPAHPLIRKWTDTLEEQIRLWKINRSILDHVNQTPQEPAPAEQPEHAGEGISKDPLEW